MEWTTELRYKPYHDWSENYWNELKQQIANSKWRLNYHIQPNTGLLNDPNGFSYFNNKWHLFYQSFPMGAVHGLKSWHHLESNDLIHWQDKGLAIQPDTKYDSHGVYSGSAIATHHHLIMMYTGNHRDENWVRHPYQLITAMDKDGTFSKKEVVITPPNDYTEHFRDPQLFRYHDHYYCLIGAQNLEKQGEIVLYQSDNLMDWTKKGALHFTNDEMGYMIECPNLIFIDKKPVLIFCPQGLDKNVATYQNIYPNMYVIGSSFNPDIPSIEQTSPLHNLDDGFDVYATQAINAPDGRALAVSWIGLPDTTYPSDNEGWANCLSLIKELTLKDGHLYQYPVSETKKLRQNKITLSNQNGTLLANQTTNNYELHGVLPAHFQGTLYVSVTKGKNEALIIHFDKETVTVDRTYSGVSFATNNGTTRTTTLPKNEPIEFNLFMDNSVFELYLNHGYAVITGRIFPTGNQGGIYMESEHKISLTCYDMERISLNEGDKSDDKIN